MENRSKDGDVRIGIIGMGYWGPRLLRCISGLAGATPVALCDIDGRNLEKYEKCGYSLYSSASDMAADSEVDAVLVSTPLKTHRDIVCELLKAQKHVFVEKPMASNIGQAEEMILAAEGTDRVLMVGQTYLYSPAVRAIKKMLQSKEIGRLRHIRMIRSHLGLRRPDTSVIWDLASHDVSMILYWLGEEPSSVSACATSCRRAGQVDIANITMKYPGGPDVRIEVSWIEPDKVRKILISGEKQIILFDDTRSTSKISLFDTALVDAAGSSPAPVSFPAHDDYEPLAAECFEFIQSIRFGQNPLADARHGLRVVRILEEAERAAVASL